MSRLDKCLPDLVDKGFNMYDKLWIKLNKYFISIGRERDKFKEQTLGFIVDWLRYNQHMEHSAKSVKTSTTI